MSTVAKERLITISNPRSAVSEAFRALRTNLEFTSLDAPLRTLLVTSAGPNAEKSITLANLAVIMAEGGNRVILVDADLRAVEAARRTLTANGILNAEVRLSDCGCDLPPGSFDVVVTNPPFHVDVEVDRAIAQRFIEASARLLHPRGRLYVVANRFLPYREWLQERFSRVGIVWEDARYRVWRCSRV